MKKFAVIVAGGSGIRMGSALPKQFILLNDKPVLWHTLNAFLHAYDDLKIILVLAKEHFAKGEELLSTMHEHRIQITEGGATRFHSVQNGLKLVKEESVVFVHDGVRCLISKKLIERCYEQTLAKGNAVPAVASTDSIRINEGERNYVMPRERVRMIQTPQTFLSKIILPAFKQDYLEAFTDEATVVEAANEKIFLIEGEYDNIKITRPADLLLAERILKERSAL